MNDRRFRIGLLSLTLVLCACGADETANMSAGLERLPPCAAEGSIFAEQSFDAWANTYHANVSNAIEAHADMLRSTSNRPLQCTEERYEERLPASSQLKEIASMLPAWNDPDAIENLSEADMAPVLLEFLRTYECAMKEHERFLTVTLLREEGGGDLSVGDLIDRKGRRMQTIADELAIARPTLERTLALVGGYDGPFSLRLEIECVKRASLDLRNVLGLAADAAACLPRALDTHGSLRDLPE